MNTWVLKSDGLNKEGQPHIAPVYTIGNGLMGCRGFFEEEQNNADRLGGIYMARVFGRADYKPWKGDGRELVNVPNFFYTKILINEEAVTINNETVHNYQQWLDLKNGIFGRSYIYMREGEPVAKLEFQRFVSRFNIYEAGQQIKITPLTEGLTISVDCGINTEIRNLNLVSSEPYPVQPGRKQYETRTKTSDCAVVEITQPDPIHLAFVQKVTATHSMELSSSSCRSYQINVKPHDTAVIQKLIAVSLSPEDGPMVEDTAHKRLELLESYNRELEKHQQAMNAFWKNSDVIIKGDEQDQLTIRYNILQLMQSCPSHTNRYSIGARGLTGEMYEGSIFWDTEIFMLPFFSLTNQAAARKLLEFRYQTLPEAKSHAANNWFRGAMYGWQVNADGVEQTPQGVGAYYSIHIVADIAFAILDYWNCTGDDSFLLDCGLEILIETARFWASRVTERPDGYFDIMAVRGPNEYDVLVNNNLYTNMMARENFILCQKLLTLFSVTHRERLEQIMDSCSLNPDEVENWVNIQNHLILPYEKEQDLWLEDDTYLRRMPLDMAKAKPTAKRIIDTTIPYEALPFYQISKQADVLHLMKNLPWYFSREQIEKAYDFYQPKTAFDSSLAYSMFALMAARVGRMDEAVAYYERSSMLDIRNVQLNTISGLHLANFGGTWQAMIFGFAGVAITEQGIELNPRLPEKWEEISFKLHYQGALFQFVINHKDIIVNRLSPTGINKTILIKGQTFLLSEYSEIKVTAERK